MSDKDIELAELLRTLGVTHPQVLAAIAQVSRQVYVEPDMQAHAYDNQALPINCGQTISQPYVVAYMSALALGDKQQLGKVLEIGTGSGYQAAILSELADEVYSVERIEQLATQAKERLAHQGCYNVKVQHSDGFLGWSEHAPFDAIIVTTAAESIPEHLLSQLSHEGGRMVAPIGKQFHEQKLQLVIRQKDQYEYQDEGLVAFVPMCHGIVNSNDK